MPERTVQIIIGNLNDDEPEFSEKFGFGFFEGKEMVFGLQCEEFTSQIREAITFWLYGDTMEECLEKSKATTANA